MENPELKKVNTNEKFKSIKSKQGAIQNSNLESEKVKTKESFPNRLYVAYKRINEAVLNKLGIPSKKMLNIMESFDEAIPKTKFYQSHKQAILANSENLIKKPKMKGKFNRVLSSNQEKVKILDTKNSSENKINKESIEQKTINQEIANPKNKNRFVNYLKKEKEKRERQKAKQIEIQNKNKSKANLNQQNNIKPKNLAEQITDFKNRVEFFRNKSNDENLSESDREKYKNNLEFTEQTLQDLRNKLVSEANTKENNSNILVNQQTSVESKDAKQVENSQNSSSENSIDNSEKQNHKSEAKDNSNEKVEENSTKSQKSKPDESSTAKENNQKEENQQETGDNNGGNQSSSERYNNDYFQGAEHFSKDFQSKDNRSKWAKFKANKLLRFQRKVERNRDYRVNYKSINENKFRDLLGEEKMRELGELSGEAQIKRRNEMIFELIKNEPRQIEREHILRSLRELNKANSRMDYFDQKHGSVIQEKVARRRWSNYIQKDIDFHKKRILEIEAEGAGSKEWRNEEIAHYRKRIKELEKIPREKESKFSKFLKERLKKRRENLKSEETLKVQKEIKREFLKNLKENGIGCVSSVFKATVIGPLKALYKGVSELSVQEFAYTLGAELAGHGGEAVLKFFKLLTGGAKTGFEASRIALEGK